MAPRDQDPGLWEADSYRIRVIHGDSESWITPSQPFALIGAAQCCDVKLVGSKNLPQVAYFICCLRDRIEAWPTAAIAFPRWGVVSPEMELLVGHFRITVHRDDPVTKDATEEEVNAEVIQTRLTANKRTLNKKLKRSVTIIGDGHPSMLRLRDQGLDQCHFAAVAQDSQLWIVNVAGQSLTLNERVQILRKPGDTARMADLSIELSPKQKEDSLAESSTQASPELSQQIGDSEKKKRAFNEDGDELSAVLTNRLINKSKSLKRRIVFATTLVLAIALAGYLWVNLLQKIYRDWF
jgi:hypothetical protein